MRIVITGASGNVGTALLRRLAGSDADHDLVGVVTRTDAPLGRKRVLTPSPVATAASAVPVMPQTFG